MPLPFDAAEVRAILLDIEGTTTPVDFVFKKLFPFASAHVEEFLRRHADETEIGELLGDLRKACEKERAKDVPRCSENTVASASAYVRWLIERDSKITALKTLQGKIWEEGFRRGELKGEVYADVAPAFVRWRGQGRRIAIFSSGSVLAQKLLFAHSTAGDLSSFLEAYFDTNTGPKREATSYRKIAEAIQLETREVLFVSDVREELDAAHAAGMKSAHSLRPGITALADRRHWEIQSFDEIFPARE